MNTQAALQKFQFAVEFGFKFEYIDVEAQTQKDARAKLWDQVLTEDQKNNASDIEFVGMA